MAERAITLGTERRRFRITRSEPWPLELVHVLQSGIRDGSEAGLDPATGTALVERLLGIGALIETAEAMGFPGLSRQEAYFAHLGIDPRLALAQIAKKRVIIVGVGGTGTIVLQHLVGAGARHIVLVDFDRVEAENLERQFIYTVGDIGRLKIDAAADYVRARAIDAAVSVIEQEVRTAQDLIAAATLPAPADLCVLCIDQPLALAFENGAQILWDAGIPTIYGGATIDGGGYGPLFATAQSSASPNAFAIRPSKGSPAHRGPVNIAFSPANTIVAALIAREAILFLIEAFDEVNFASMTAIGLADRRFTSIEAD